MKIRKRWREIFVPGGIIRFHCIMHATITRFTIRPLDTTIVPENPLARASSVMKDRELYYIQGKQSTKLLL